jgi:hypothetical protein
MMTRWAALSAALALGACQAASELHGPRALNVSYDARSLILNGERRLWVSGGMHYSRHQPQLWAPVLQQAKEAGLVGVTSYVMWNQHENVRGTYDWGQVQPRSNVTRFLQTAHDLGMLVHLRLGPYIDGEWNYGGFPWWINQVDTTPGDNSAFESEMKRWIGALVDHIRPFLASNGGPIIMMQIENEFSDQTPGGMKYAEWAMAMAEALDTGIPWTFCNNSGSATYTLPPNMISTANAGMGPSDFIRQKLCGKESTAYPNQPCIWTEIEEEFYQWSGSDDGGVAPAVFANQQLQWYSLGGAGSNYYMWSGGTDYGLSAGDDDTTSYHQYSCLEPVFDKPNEPKYSFLGRLHKVLREHETVLLAQDPPKSQPLSIDKSCFVHTYTNASVSLHFVANEGTAGVEVSVDGAKFYVPAATRLLLSSPKFAGPGHTPSAPPALVFNSSAVGGNTDPPFQIKTATTAPLKWMKWVEGTPRSYDPVLVSSSGLAKLRSAGSTPTEQVELELTLAGAQVTDYAWYSTEYAAPATASSTTTVLSPVATATSFHERAGRSLAVQTCVPHAPSQLWSLVPIAKWSKKVAVRSVGDATLCVAITDEQYDGGNGTALVPCNPADPKQQWQTGLGGTHIAGAGNLCLDVQDASTKDGANVMSYQCGPRPGGNQRWSVVPAGTKGENTIVTKLDNMCLGTHDGSNSTREISGELHESTLGFLFLNSTYVGLIDNQNHNGKDTRVATAVAPSVFPKAGTVTALELLSSTVGISADIASMNVALAESVEYLGLKSESNITSNITRVCCQLACLSVCLLVSLTDCLTHVALSAPHSSNQLSLPVDLSRVHMAHRSERGWAHSTRPVGDASWIARGSVASSDRRRQCKGALDQPGPFERGGQRQRYREG